MLKQRIVIFILGLSWFFSCCITVMLFLNIKNIIYLKLQEYKFLGEKKQTIQIKYSPSPFTFPSSEVTYIASFYWCKWWCGEGFSRENRFTVSSQAGSGKPFLIQTYHHCEARITLATRATPAGAPGFRGSQEGWGRAHRTSFAGGDGGSSSPGESRLRARSLSWRVVGR